MTTIFDQHHLPAMLNDPIGPEFTLVILVWQHHFGSELFIFIDGLRFLYRFHGLYRTQFILGAPLGGWYSNVGLPSLLKFRRTALPPSGNSFTRAIISIRACRPRSSCRA